MVSFHIVGKHDLTYELIPLALWSSVSLCRLAPLVPADIFSRDAEIASGIICGCMPVVPQFFRHFMPKIKSHFSSYHRSKVASDSAGVPSGENVVTPWEEFDDSQKLKGQYVDIDLQSVGQTSVTNRDQIRIHARQVSDCSISQDKPAGNLESGLHQ